MPVRMTKGSSNRLSFCDLREAFTIMKNDDLATHWALEHSEDRSFSVWFTLKGLLMFYM